MNPNRRRFLRQSALALGSLPVTALFHEVAFAAASGRRVVLVELSGANDGLNTVIPYRDDDYYRLRPSLAIGSGERIALNDADALHVGLEPLMPWWERGELAWARGLGYPKANRSHFASIALWETGGDGRAPGEDGWITHDVEHRLGRAVADAHGVSLAGGEGLFRSDDGRWLALDSPDELSRLQRPVLHVAASDNPALAAIAERAGQLDAVLARFTRKLADTPAAKRVGPGELGEQLTEVVRMIRAGVDTPVYRVQLRGFDTHENQLGRHARLLGELARSLAGFATALERDGEWSNTLVMTYSEFGRRVAENQSKGTDHGKAAPHLVIGPSVRGGLYGTPPDLRQLDDGDLAYEIDYRALYERALGGWFGIEDNRFAAQRDPRLDALIG